MKLVDLFPESMVVLDLEAGDKPGVIRELVGRLVDKGQLAAEQSDAAVESVLAREKEGSTGIGRGLAIPHAKNCDFIDDIVGVFGRVAEGVSYESVDGEPVHVLFLVLSSSTHGDQHLQIMRKVAQIARDEKSLRYLATNANAEGVREILEEFDEAQT